MSNKEFQTIIISLGNNVYFVVLILYLSYFNKKKFDLILSRYCLKQNRIYYELYTINSCRKTLIVILREN